MSNERATVLDSMQLDTKAMIKEAIASHFGKRPLPQIVEGLRIKPHRLFARKHLGADKTAKFFDTVINGQNKFLSNQNETNLPAEKLEVFAGISLRESAGAVGANVYDLDFDVISQTKLENGLLTLEINGKKVIDKQPIKEMFDNDDAIKSFLRFAVPVVREPNSRIEMTIEAEDGVGDFWAQPTLVGFILEKE